MIVFLTNHHLADQMNEGEEEEDGGYIAHVKETRNA
jgi:hypothetical protein